MVAKDFSDMLAAPIAKQTLIVAGFENVYSKVRVNGKKRNETFGSLRTLWTVCAGKVIVSLLASRGREKKGVEYQSRASAK